MDTADKVSLGLSSLSIIMTVALAIVGYYWFVPGIREYELRGRLQVSGQRPAQIDGGYWNSSLKYRIDLHNVGALPAKDVKIVVRYSLVLFEPRKPTITVDPPIPIEANDNNTQILLKQAVAPDGHVFVNFSELPVTIWVLSETGDTSIVQAGGPEIEVTTRAQEQYEYLLKYGAMPHPSKPPPRRRRR